METSVIVVDSSDDETYDPKINVKKTIKRIHAKDATCLSVPLKNKSQITSKPFVNQKPALKSAPIIQNNNIECVKRKTDSLNELSDSKRFKSKLDTGEITILPISIQKNTDLTIVKRSSKEMAIEIKTVPKVSSPPSEISPTVRRIIPMTITREVTSFRTESGEDSIDSDARSKDSFTTSNDYIRIAANGESSNDTVPSRDCSKVDKTPINDTFNELLSACRAADTSIDMEKLINKKLIRYYQCVHSTFVNSKSFQKTVANVTADVIAKPQHVYLKINGILEELKTRRAYKCTENGTEKNEKPIDAEPISTGDKKIDLKVHRLSRALRKLQKRIEIFDNAEVDWDDDHNSAFMINERCKKRAYQIYEKICDLTGESKDALRCTKKPIKFNGTNYDEFNRKIQTFINRTKAFPDLYDVLRVLEHCNNEYQYGLKKDECRKIASDAFVKIGNALQKRRKTELYEMVSYFGGSDKDPAKEDEDLQRKLNDNKTEYKIKLEEIFNKFVERQSAPDDSDNDDSKNASHNNSKDILSDLNTTVEINSLNKSIVSNSNESIVMLDDDVHNESKVDKVATHRNNIESNGNNELDNNNHENESNSSPLLTIASVTSLSTYTMDNQLLFDDSNIIISDDEEFTFNNAL